MPDCHGRTRTLRARWTRVRSRSSPLRLSPTREAEIVDELSQHLDDRYRELIAGGASPDEADAADARRVPRAATSWHSTWRRCGRRTRRRRSTPGAPTGHVFSDLWQDLRYAARMFCEAAAASPRRRS